MSKLDGKVAIISGSGRGIGRALALKLASEGAAVVVNDLDDAPAQEVVEAIKAAGGNAVACVGNVAAPDFGERFVKTALDNFSDLHIIVNNAGYTRDAVIQKMDDAQFQEMLDIHTVAPFRILRAAAEHFRTASKQEAAEGRAIVRKVVNVSSIAGTIGSAGQANYSSAKAAMIGLTKTMAKEWGRYKICVNCIAFGFINTRLTQSLDRGDTITIEGRDIKVGVPNVMIETAGQTIPLGRPGTPEEGANGIYLFCAPESDYVSGQVLVVSGGL